MITHVRSSIYGIED